MNPSIKKIKAEQCLPLRQRVMWPDKPLSYVQLADDAQGIHYGLFLQDRLVSIASLFVSGHEAQFRKLTTEIAEQGKGYGSLLLHHVFDEAKTLNVQRIWCNARVSKESFYHQFGLQETEKRFTKGGLDYVIMARDLKQTPLSFFSQGI